LSLEFQKQKFLRLGVPEKNIRVEVESASNPIRKELVFQKKDLIDSRFKLVSETGKEDIYL
jgi:hypothetical protein